MANNKMKYDDSTLLADYSSKVDVGMSFPYSQGYPSRQEAPTKRQTYNAGPSKNMRDLSNGMAHKDGLVASTKSGSKSASLNLGNPTVSRYHVEHLASFQHEADNEITPAEALNKLKALSEDRGLSTQSMSMKLTDEMIEMSNGMTMEVIEEYQLDNINLFTHIVNHPVLKNLFIFSTKFSADKIGAIHIFQCNTGEAAIISTDVNRRRKVKPETMTGASVNGGFSNEVEQPNERRSPDFNRTSVKQSRGVSQRIEAFQKITESPPSSAGVTRQGSKSAADYPSEIQEARVNRDVETLNRCVEEIEQFIFDLKSTNEARKKLNKKGRRSTKKKYDRTRTIARGPSEESCKDIYQKFKYAFNLLGKLKPHITNPNSTEFVHYLMVPLDIVVKVDGFEHAQSIMTPWLSISAIDMLSNCLNSWENSFWKSLGPNWNLPQSAPIFHDKPHSIYVPVFKDGWSPTEIITDDRNAAAAKSAASMVARMKEAEFGTPKTKKMVAKAVLKFRSLAREAQLRTSAMNEHKRVSVDAEPEVVVETARKLESPRKPESPRKTEAPRIPEEKPTPVVNGTTKYAVVAYDYWAHNNKELTIRAGERVLVLDDTRRWWLVKNDHDEQGYVPSTVLEYPTQDDSDSSSADGTMSGPHSPHSTLSSGYVEMKPPQVSSDVPKTTEPSSPTVFTAKSIITESAQFSRPVPPKEPPPPVSPKPQSKEEPPQFLPPPPPVQEPVASPRLVVNMTEIKESSVLAKQEEAPSFQSELTNRLNTPPVTNSNSLQTSDGVDFFIPLFKSSTADDVSRWLKKLDFDPLTVERLKGVAAKDLFKMPEDDLVERLGEVEGNRLHNELEAQIGAQTRHKTMTEFQKVLVQRMQRQEAIQKNVKSHHVVVKSPAAGVPSQDEMQKKFLEQQELLKDQKPKENGVDTVDSSREPEKPSFTSFTSPTVNNNTFDFTSENASK